MYKKQDPGRCGALLQKKILYIASSYFKLCKDRRELTLPGSTRVGGDVLFGKEELEELKGTRKLRTPPHKGVRRWYSIPTFSLLVLTGKKECFGK